MIVSSKVHIIEGTTGGSIMYFFDDIEATEAMACTCDDQCDSSYGGGQCQGCDD